MTKRLATDPPGALWIDLALVLIPARTQADRARVEVGVLPDERLELAATQAVTERRRVQRALAGGSGLDSRAAEDQRNDPHLVQ